MTISLVRIDDRLIHGQVAFGWTTALGINTILVVNDDAKNDQMKSMALNLAKPSNVVLYIRGVAESGEIVQKFASSKKSNVLVLVKTTEDARRLVSFRWGNYHIKCWGFALWRGEKEINGSSGSGRKGYR